MSETYSERWAARERRCGLGAVASTMITCGVWTLPKDAAPGLSFDRADQPLRVWEVFGSRENWSDADRTRLASYLVIGSDSAGNPICLDERTGAVWLLDHEDHFKTPQFVNSGIPQLAECLLAYMGERDPERFRSAVHTIDPPALAEASFWTQEGANLKIIGDPIVGMFADVPELIDEIVADAYRQRRESTWRDVDL